MRTPGGRLEQAAGTKVVPVCLTGVVEDAQEELGDRIRLRGMLREGPQDTTGGRIIAAQHRTDAVFRGRLRRGGRGEKRENAGQTGGCGHGSRTGMQTQRPRTARERRPERVRMAEWRTIPGSIL